MSAEIGSDIHGKPLVASDVKNTLGEGPFWDSQIRALFWVDIIESKIYRMKEGRLEVSDAPALVSSISKNADGGYIITAGNAIYSWNGSTFIKLCSIDESGTRFNDAKCGPDGGLWAGTMDLEQHRAIGNLYRVGRDLKPEKVLSMLTISNGLGWSPEGTVMYHADTPKGCVFAYDFNDGKLANRRIAFRFKENEGLPDGLCIDEEGCIWVAHYGGGRVSRWASDGRKLGEILFPTKNITSVAFGGDDLDVLFVTSARYGLESPDAAAGALFKLKPGVHGIENYTFGSR